jgi:hypothetical protein
MRDPLAAALAVALLLLSNPGLTAQPAPRPYAIPPWTVLQKEPLTFKRRSTFLEDIEKELDPKKAPESIAEYCARFAHPS